MSAEFVLVQGWVGWLSLLAVGSQTSGSLWWWEGGQVDSTHTAAPEILEDRFTTCQILLVAHSPHWGHAQWFLRTQAGREMALGRQMEHHCVYTLLYRLWGLLNHLRNAPLRVIHLTIGKALGPDRSQADRSLSPLNPLYSPWLLSKCKGVNDKPVGSWSWDRPD